ncbi:Collagen alpha-6(VI) chain [Bulinus truncatus]|nr:Collagen alpha-6(VI) chain [Bulinus truncatus]
MYIAQTTTTLPPPPSVIPCYNTTKADIILLIDASTSIGPDNWLKQAKFASELVQAFTVGPKDVLFGCLIFNRTPTKIFDLKTYMNSTSASNSLLSIPYPNNQGTNTHLGLSEIRVNQLFSPASGGRTDARDLVIVMTDGQSNSPDLTKSEAQQLKDTGVSIITVGIGLSNTNELTAMASKHEYVFNTGGYDMLDYIKRDLVKLTCEGV